MVPYGSIWARALFLGALRPPRPPHWAALGPPIRRRHFPLRRKMSPPFLGVRVTSNMSAQTRVWHLCVVTINLAYPVGFLLIFGLRDPSHWLRAAIPSNLPHKSSQMVGYDAGNDARIRILEFWWFFVILLCFTSPLWARCHPAGAFFSSKNMSPEIWSMSFWDFVILGPF